MTKAMPTSQKTVRSLPPAMLGDPREETADLVECLALTGKDGQASLDGLRSEMALTGSVDAYFEPEDSDYAEAGGPARGAPPIDDTDRYEAAAHDAFAEISERTSACGPAGYPFAVGPGRIASSKTTISSVYAFMLLLSKFGPDAGPRRSEGAKLFEELCASALAQFLGGREALAKALVFGFPRQGAHTGFADAVDALCATMAEGKAHRPRPTTGSQKDAKLDVVAWKGFPDGKKGKLILFRAMRHRRALAGQSGTELIPTDAWCRKWMEDPPHVLPLELSSSHTRLLARSGTSTCVDGGLLFDRFRITCHSTQVPEVLSKRLTKWSKHVVREQRGN